MDPWEAQEFPLLGSRCFWIGVWAVSKVLEVERSTSLGQAAPKKEHNRGGQNKRPNYHLMDTMGLYGGWGAAGCQGSIRHGCSPKPRLLGRWDLGSKAQASQCRLGTQTGGNMTGCVVGLHAEGQG